MPYFKPFVYRFFACLAIIVIASCSPSLDDESEAPTLRTEHATTPVNAKRTEAAEIARAAGGTTVAGGNINDYAPPTNIKVDPIGGQTTPETAPFGAPTHSGAEAVSTPTIKIGLLIPMTGGSAELGQSLLDAAILAVYDKYSTMAPRDITARIELLPEDTGDSIEGAEKSAQDAIEAGATMILGPVFSKQVSAVASIARSKNVPVVTFSNNATVAGDGVYLFGFIPEQQVVRVIQYAISRKFSNVAALVPSNPYGATIVKQLSTEMRKNNGRAHPIEYYQENLSGLDVNVGRLSRFLQEQQTNKGQALFIAEGGAKLKSLTETLTMNNIALARFSSLALVYGTTQT